MDKSINELRILMLEDALSDAELEKNELEDAELAFTMLQVATREAFLQALDEFKPNIVLADYRLPAYNGRDALEYVRRTHPQIPVIMVTGAIGDEAAVELLKMGARDYVLKDQLARLAPAIKRVLSEERDIRDKRAAEEALQESEEKYRLFFAMESDAIIVIDPETKRIMDANEAALNLYQYGREEFLKLRITDISAEPGKTLETIGEKMEGAIIKTPLHWHKKKNGTAFPVETSGSSFTAQGRTWVFSIFRDISERVEAEKKLNEYAKELERHRDHLEALVAQRTSELDNTYRQLLHSEKLAALGKLAASLAHEISNPIMGIRSVMEQVHEDSSINAEFKNLVGLAARECNRIADLAKKLRDFHRPTPDIARPLDINAVIDDVLALAMKKMKERNIKLEKHYDEKMPEIEAVGDQIKQVILNLVQNAEEAIGREGGKITITTEALPEAVRFCVRDTGSGISPDHLDMIFLPFFTTKGSEQGSGLGLAVSYGIVKAHGGAIEVQSKPGEGATFTVTLPLKRKPPQ